MRWLHKRMSDRNVTLDSEQIILCYHSSLLILKIKMDFSAKIQNGWLIMPIDVGRENYKIIKTD